MLQGKTGESTATRGSAFACSPRAAGAANCSSVLVFGCAWLLVQALCRGQLHPGRIMKKPARHHGMLVSRPAGSLPACQDVSTSGVLFLEPRTVGEKLGRDTKGSQRWCLDPECRHPDGSWRGHGAQGACPSSLQHHSKRVLVFSSLKASRKMQSAKILASLRALESCGLAQGTQIPVPWLPALRGCWAQPCFRSTQPNEMRTAMFFVLHETQRAPRGVVVVVKKPPAPEQDLSHRVLGVFFFSPRAQAKSQINLKSD